MQKQIMRLAIIAFGLTLMGCQAPRPVADQLSEEDVSAIKNSVKSFIQAVLANDWTAWAEHYAEDGVVMPPNEPPVEGRAAILEWWTASGLTAVEFNITSLEIEGRDGLAYRRGTFSTIFTMEETAEAIKDSGKFIEIWKKQANGSWKIWRDVWNSSMPLPSTSYNE